MNLRPNRWRRAAMVAAAATGLVLYSGSTASAAPTASPELPALAQSESCSVPSTANDTVLKTVYQTGLADHVSDRVLLAGFEAGWVESHLNNLDCGDLDSIGVFQQRDSWGTTAQRLDVGWASNAFFTPAKTSAANNPTRSAGWVAQSVQRSAYPDRYDEAQGTAEQLIARAKTLVGNPPAGTASQVSSVARGSTINVFVTDATHHLVQKWYSGGKWSAWEQLGGTLTSGPSAVVTRDGTIHVFATDTSHHLVQKWYTGGNWSGWQQLGGTLTSGPSAMVDSAGTLHVFAADTGHRLVQKWYTGGKWSGWQNLAGTLSTAAPSALVTSDHTIHVFVTDATHHLVQKWYTGGNWSGWQQLGGTLTSGPSAMVDSAGTLHVFAADTGHRLVQKWYTGGKWSGWQNLAGTLSTAAPSALVTSDHTIHVFATDATHHLVQKWYSGGTWSPWQQLGGTLT